MTGEQAGTAEMGEAAARRLRRAAVLLSIGIALAAVVGFTLAIRFAEANRARDLEAWRDRLTVSAEARAAALDDWIGGERDIIASVARNPTIAFYLTELAAVGAPQKVTDGDARLAIIETYLLFTAEQSGFTAAPQGPAIAANIARARRAGLVVTDAAGRPLASTAAMPAYAAAIAAYKAAAPRGPGVHVHDLYAGEAGEPTLMFVAPVFALDDAGKGGQPLGFVVGARLAQPLYDRLAQPGDDKTATRTLLVRKRGASIEYLSPLDDGTPPFAKTLPADDPEQAAAFAVARPGSFGERRDIHGHPVLATGVALKTMPWVVLHMVDAKRALHDIIERRNATLIIFGLVILCLAGAVLLLWRYGASLRAAAAAARAEALAARFADLSAFLKGVSNAQPTHILAFDADGLCRFANDRATAAAGLPEADLAGKAARAIFGLPLGPALDADNRTVLGAGSPLTRMHSVAMADGTRILKADHLPLAAIAGDPRRRPGTLVVLEDVTELVTERERREDNLRQLVSTLVGLIDSRDPYAARHSRWTAELAEAIAQGMGLEDVTVETAEIAGALLNLGKVLVPRAVLIKNAALSPAELDDVRRSLQKSADLVQGVAFNGPVVATIRQAQAHWDGSGLPAGLAGEDILMTARIVAVANAFVGMISARAHRAPLTLDAVIDILLSRVGSLYDRRPVAALVHYLDNQGGRALWEVRSRETATPDLPSADSTVTDSAAPDRPQA